MANDMPKMCGASTPQPAAAETVSYAERLAYEERILAAEMEALRATQVERERCAKIAEGMFANHGKLFRTQRASNYEIAGKRIAAAIRRCAKDGK